LKKRSSTTQARHRQLLRQERRLKACGYSCIAGVDEAGRGPLAGPVVASAVILKDVNFSAQIDDSKKLSAKRREQAYGEIREKAVVGIGIVDEKIIDEINIYRATLKAMEMAINNLEIPPDYVIVDGRVRLSTKSPVKCIIKGDSRSMSIAAASIIAKVTRDRIMAGYDTEYPLYGFRKHKGYPTRSHKAALKRFGPSPIHRRSYQPVKDVI
jgi:ribonuclease HII